MNENKYSRCKGDDFLSKLTKYIPLIKFMGQVFGSDFEIILHDVSQPDTSIIAIENSHISGRHVGDCLTDLARQWIAQKKYLETNYIVNYEGKTAGGHNLVSSTYFIKDEDTLIGLLCINHNTDSLLEAQRIIHALTSAFYLPDKNASNYSERFSGSILDISSNRILKTLNSFNVTPKRMSAAEKIELVKKLDEQEIFSTKGAIAQVADYLNVSEPTIYRYLSKVRKKQN